MTSSLRRKRRTTVRVGTTLVRTAASLLGLGLLLSGGTAFAQDPSTPSRGWFSPATTTAPKTLYFTKDPTPMPPDSTAYVPAQPVPVLPPPSDPTVFAPAKSVPLTPPVPPVRTAFVPAYPVPLLPPTNNGILRTAMQGAVPPPKDALTANQGPSDEYDIDLAPPGPQKLFRLESERSLFERMRMTAITRPSQDRIQFPEEPEVAMVNGVRQTWKDRAYPPMQEVVEACYTCYDRLYFEERNSERYGWDLGFIQPFVSAGYFFKDLLLLPYHMGTDPFRNYDCNSGYCLPGDPLPYVLYPPGLSVTGLVAEGATWVGISALFP